jgi:hypothetical protein
MLIPDRFHGILDPLPPCHRIERTGWGPQVCIDFLFDVNMLLHPTNRSLAKKTQQNECSVNGLSQQIYVDLRSKSRIASKNIQEEMAKHAWRVLAVSIMDGGLRCVHLEARCVHLEAEIVWLFFLQVRLSVPTWMMIPHNYPLVI